MIGHRGVGESGVPSGRLEQPRARWDCLLCCVAGLAALVHQDPSAARPAPRQGAQLIDAYANLPLTFETNRGQVSEPRVKFLCRGAGYTLFLTAGEAVLALEESPSGVQSQRSEGEPAELGPEHSKPGIWPSFEPLLPSFKLLRLPAHQPAEPRAWTVLRMRLLGAESVSQVVGLDELPGKSNYFLGSDSEKWFTNVPSFARVEYQGVYPGVDLAYYGNQRRLEYDFVVSPGADPRAIRLGIQGADKIDFDPEGDLRLETAGGEVRLHKPVVYQPDADDRREESQRVRVKKHFIEGRYALRAPSKSHNQKPEIEVSFEIASYDPARPLVIDPLLSYSTYLGGHGSDLGSAIAVDSAGSAYVTGYTLSTDFPTTPGTLQSAFAGGSPYGDVFVAKLNPAASALVYSTYLGGSDDDLGTGIAVDSAGNAYVTGYTRSNNFPTTSGALRRTLAGGTCGQAPSTFPCGDAFVAKLNPIGNGLVYSTYLGGTQDDWAFAIAIDSSASAYVTGYSESTDFPTTAGAFEPTASGGTCGTDPCPEAFATKLNAAGSTLAYSTYLGGIGGRGYGIAVDSSGNAYLAGSTDSLSFPTTPGAFQTVAGQNGDAFVVKLRPDGSGLVYSTYLGGGGVDVGTALALDSSGNAYVTGLTDSFNFPTTPGVLQGTCGGCASSFHDAFVTKLNAAGSALFYSTFLGGSNDDLGFGIAVDSMGNAYVAGRTLSIDFPTSNPFQGQCGGGCSAGFSDAFVARLNTGGSALIYSTYLGGTGNDSAYGIALDSVANAYLTGITSSSDFPTTVGGYQRAPGGVVDAFVTKLDPPTGAAASLSSASLAFPVQLLNTTSSPETVTLQNIGNLSLAINSVAASGDYAETDTCGTSVAPGVLCTLSVTFTPNATGARTGAITIADNALGGPQAITLNGIGIAPAVATLSSTQLSFADQGVGTTSAALEVTLSNGGGKPLNIASIAVAGDFAESNTCGTSVAAGASCVLSVTFSPTTIGVRTGTLAIADNGAGSPQTLALSGNGIPGFLLAAGSSSAVVIRGADSTQFTVSASSPSGFASAISLACSGNGLASCAFSPGSITPGQTAALAVGNLKAVTANSLTFAVTGSSGQQSAQVQLSVTLADFSLSPSPTTLTVRAGQTSTSSVGLTPVAGFTGALSLACSGAPPEASCSISPASISLNGSSASTATMTVTTTARSAEGRRPWLPFAASSRWSGILAALIGWFVAAVRHRRFGRLSLRTEGAQVRRGVGAAAVVTLLAVATACGSGGNAGQGRGLSGTPAGTYSLTVSASYTGPSATLTHSATVTLTVN